MPLEAQGNLASWEDRDREDRSARSPVPFTTRSSQSLQLALFLSTPQLLKDLQGPPLPLDPEIPPMLGQGSALSPACLSPAPASYHCTILTSSMQVVLVPAGCPTTRTCLAPAR